MAGVLGQYDISIRSVLEPYNPWNREIDYGTDRLFYYQEIVSFLFRKEIQVITGIRRCGKTTLLKQCMKYLLDNGIAKEQILFIPCDDPMLGIRDFNDLHGIVKMFQADKKLFIFLDEVQTVKGWEKYLKSVYGSGSNVKFMITGSTASFFEKDVANYLTGRYIYHKISTLTYKEYQRLKPGGSLMDYVEWGGFPEVVKADSVEQKSTILRDYLKTIVLHDIVQRNRLRNGNIVESLLDALVSTVGGKVNPSKLSRQFGIGRKTAERYISMGIDGFLFDRVDFFSHSRRKHIQKEYKVYPADYGFCRLLNGRFEKGRAMEWAVLHALPPDPSYWSSDGHEVDFVSKNTAIQVCAYDEPPEREIKGLIAFKRTFALKGLMLSNQTTDKTVSIEEFLLNPDIHLIPKG